jgi:hypothetical protein
MRPLSGYVIPALLVGFRDIAWLSLIIWLVVFLSREPSFIERFLLGLAFYAACSILFACYLLAALAVKARAGALDLTASRTWKEKLALVSDHSVI